MVKEVAVVEDVSEDKGKDAVTQNLVSADQRYISTAGRVEHPVTTVVIDAV